MDYQDKTHRHGTVSRSHEGTQARNYTETYRSILGSPHPGVGDQLPPVSQVHEAYAAGASCRSGKFRPVYRITLATFAQ